MTIRTAWEVWMYDVWGNEEDGWEVNDRSCIDRCYEIDCFTATCNEGTDQQFVCAYPSNEQIREALGIKPDVEIEVDGDDLYISVNSAKDGYPVGEMLCVSHDCLSPIGNQYREWDDNGVFHRRYPDPPPYDAATQTGMYDREC